MFLAVICVFVIIGCVAVLKSEDTTPKGKTIAVVIIVAAAIAIVAYFASSSSSSSSGRKWSDLSEVEKDNARWAYNAKQAIDKYGY